MQKQIIQVIYNDGLDQYIRRFSTRKLAQNVAVAVRERGIEARFHDRGYAVKPKERYEVLVKAPDHDRAYMAMSRYLEIK